MRSKPISVNTMEACPVAVGQILLIDDDPFMLELLSDMLSSLGASRVLVAADGQQALTVFEQCHASIDLVISDLEMPNADGFQLMEELAMRNFPGGVILLSGLAVRVLNSAALMGHFHSLRILGTLQKPVTIQGLQTLLSGTSALHR